MLLLIKLGENKAEEEGKQTEEEKKKIARLWAQLFQTTDDIVHQPHLPHSNLRPS